MFSILLVLRGLAFAEVGDRVARVNSNPAIAAVLLLSVSGDRGAARRALSDVQESRPFCGCAAAAPFDRAGAPFFLAVIFFRHPLLGWYALSAALLLLSVALAATALSEPRLVEAEARTHRAVNEASGLLRDPTLREGLSMERAIERCWRMRRGAALARSLFDAPPVLVPDAPDSSLDHAAEAVLIEALEAARRRGAAILAATYQRSLSAIADRVWRLDGDRLVVHPDAPASPSPRTSGMTP